MMTITRYCCLPTLFPEQALTTRRRPKRPGCSGVGSALAQTYELYWQHMSVEGLDLSARGCMRALSALHEQAHAAVQRRAACSRSSPHLSISRKGGKTGARIALVDQGGQCLLLPQAKCRDSVCGVPKADSGAAARLLHHLA